MSLSGEPIDQKKPVINCHTHIFTGDHVPPYIAKTFIWWPFYYLLHIQLIVGFFKFWYLNPGSPYAWPQKPWYKRIAKIIYSFNAWIKRVRILYVLKLILSGLLSLYALFFLFEMIDSLISASTSSEASWIRETKKWLINHNLMIPFNSNWSKVLLVILVLLFIPVGRRAILWVLTRIWKFVGIFRPDPKTIEFLKRYLNIGRFAFYAHQSKIFERLQDQYPKETKFIILPMDMEFMGAGKPKATYKSQMDELVALKQRHPEIVYPFVFIDPRRMKDKSFFDYKIIDGKIELQSCDIKSYIEENKFSGFKIYPALGYYVFDEDLLLLWKYAADHNLPVLTHCIRGTIFYRGTKKKEWDTHPVFMQGMGGDVVLPLILSQLKNVEFINNFTHPLNYLCLLDQTLLTGLVAKASNPDVRLAYGWNKNTNTIQQNLSSLKLCFGHYGGDDEWQKYFEADRDVYSAQFTSRDEGIDFTHNASQNFSWAKLEQIWKTTDWYSIISSFILQYPNVYADISYIIHNPEILPLLNRTLMVEKRHLKTGTPLRERVLFGTDFYVVRNHKSEKNMLADMLASLSEEEFDLIARTNPAKFLF